MTMDQPSHLTEIIKGQLYLGNLSAALSVEQRAKLGITHVVSVCPDYSSTGPNHLVVPIEDSEYHDLLVHLPSICDFVDEAFKENGRVLIHCVMGISRSTSAVAAYLMKSRRVSVSDAIGYLKQLRSIIHPNYGFIRQLYVFADCSYKPSRNHPQYLSWKRRHKQDVKTYLNYLEDTFSLIPHKVLLTSEYPQDIVHAQSYILDLGVTKITSIEPAELPSNQPFTQHERFRMPSSSSAHSDTLNAVCRSIRDAVEKGGQVLLYCENEAKLCVAACAFLMSVQGLSMPQAVSIVEDVVPLFDKSPTFVRMLEAYDNSCMMGQRNAASKSRSHQRHSIMHIEFGKTSFDLEVAPISEKVLG